MHIPFCSVPYFLPTGLHFEDKPFFVFAGLVRYAGDTLRADMLRNSNKRHMYRLTYPAHWGPHGVYLTLNATMYPSCTQSTERHWTALAAAGLLTNDIPLLDYYPVLKDRGDLHSRHPFENRLDCTHWCYAYELFYPMWQMIVDHMNSASQTHLRVATRSIVTLDTTKPIQKPT